MKMNVPVARRQSGVVLLLCLIVLVVLLAGGVAVVRSMNASLQSAGNLAFRRDLVNQGEQALSTVLVQFKVGGVLATGTTSDLPAANYKSSKLANNPQGIPTVLVDDSTFASVGTAADIDGATPDVKIRYVVDRLCSSSGVPASNTCVKSAAAPTGGSAIANGGRPKQDTATVYRVSIRVSGARGTQVFLQSSITKPD